MRVGVCFVCLRVLPVRFVYKRVNVACQLLCGDLSVN